MSEDSRNPLSWITNRTIKAIDVDDIVEGVDVDAIARRIDVNSLLERVDVQALVDRIDPTPLVDRIDPNALLDRVDPNALLDRVDANRLLDRVDPNTLLDRVDPDRLLERVTPDVLLDRVDPNALLDRVDPDRLLDRVDPDRLLDRVDPDRLLERVNPDVLLDRVDPTPLVDRIDPNPLLDRVDPNALLDRVDPDRLLDRVDPERLVARVDANALIDRVDIDRVMDRVDVVELVDRAGVADIVRESTGAVAGSVLDVVRRQVVGLDTIVGRFFYRVRRGDPETRPSGPTALASDVPVLDGRRQVTGTYAGPVSRTAAFVVDALLVFWVFTLGSAGIAWVLKNFGVAIPDASDWTVWGIIGFALWAFCYWWFTLALTGRTVGKSLLGLRVVAKDGSPVTAREAGVRTLVMPLSFVFLLGIIPVLFTARRTTLHDWVGHTGEVYDWGDRPAELPAPLTAWIADRDPATPLTVVPPDRMSA